MAAIVALGAAAKEKVSYQMMLTERVGVVLDLARQSAAGSLQHSAIVEILAPPTFFKTARMAICFGMACWQKGHVHH